MLLNSAEEWTILNETSVAHPFHIHVNPFQIVEVYDPNNDKRKSRVRIVNKDDMAAAQKRWGTTKTLVEGPAVWWDNFAIPIAKQRTEIRLGLWYWVLMVLPVIPATSPFGPASLISQACTCSTATSWRTKIAA